MYLVLYQCPGEKYGDIVVKTSEQIRHFCRNAKIREYPETNCNPFEEGEYAWYVSSETEINDIWEMLESETMNFGKDVVFITFNADDNGIFFERWIDGECQYKPVFIPEFKDDSSKESI